MFCDGAVVETSPGTGVPNQKALQTQLELRPSPAHPSTDQSWDAGFPGDDLGKELCQVGA